MNNSSFPFGEDLLTEEPSNVNKYQFIWIICESTSLCSVYLLIVLSVSLFKPKFAGKNFTETSTRGNSQKRKSEGSFRGYSKTNASSSEAGERFEGRINETNNSTSAFNRRRISTVIPSPKARQRDGNKWLLRTLLMCVLLSVIRCIVEQSLLLFGSSSSHTCNVLSKLMISFTAFTLHVCHVFLWLRQLTFYKSPLLKPLRSKRLKMLSYSAYYVMPITLIIVLALYLSWRDFVVINGDCKGGEELRYSQYVPFGVLLFSTATLQILLSSLFLYPLITHRKKRKGLQQLNPKPPEAVVQRPTKRSFRSKSPDKLMACIRRVLRGATIGITTDIVGALCGMFLPLDTSLFILSVLYNCNVTLNIICVIYTFANWRGMIFPCIKKK